MNHPEIIIVPSFFFMVGYIAWLWASATQRRQRIKLLTEFNGKLLDKLGSVNDFSQFLQTDAGSRFMRDLASEPVLQASGPQERIMRAAQVGIVLACLGVGLLLVSLLSATPDGQQGFIAIGAIALSLGVGFVLSAVASYRLAGTLGLLNPVPKAPAEPVTSPL